MKRTGLVLIVSVFLVSLNLCLEIVPAGAIILPPTNYTLTVTVNGTGRVTEHGTIVTSSSRTLIVPEGYSLSLLAEQADANFIFANWVGCDKSSTGPNCNVTMTDNITVTANFVRGTASVQLTVDGAGGGTVTSSPAGIASNVSVTKNFPQSLGLPLSLHAEPDGYSVFGGWSGSCSGSSVNCSIGSLSPVNVVNATFGRDTAHMVRLERVSPLYFLSIQSAYVTANSGETIKAWALEFDEYLDCAGDKVLTLKGGYDSGYATQVGMTTLRTPLTIAKGTLTVDNIIVAGEVSDTTAPTVPANLTATAASTTQINLSWTASTDAVGVTGYTVYRGGSPLKNVTGTSTTDAALSPGTQYCYAVAAYDAAGNTSAASTPLACATTLTQAPAAPSNLAVVPENQSTSLKLNWTDNSSNETGFRINRSTNGSSGFTEVASLPAGTTTWTDTGVSSCTTYYYQVYAYNPGGNSGNATGNGKTAPAAPTGLVASNGLPLLGVYLDWDTTSCATKYKIYERNIVGGNNYVFLGEAPQNLADVNSAPGIYLFYRVSAVDADNHEGPASCAVKSGANWGGATSANDSCHAAIGWGASPQPTNAWASEGNYQNSIRIGWSPVQMTWNYNGQGTNTYATNYNVWYSYDNQPTYESMNWTQLQDRIVPSTSSAPVTMTINVDPPSSSVVHFKISTAGYPSYPTYVSGWAAVGSTSQTPGKPMITVSSYYPGQIMVGWSSIASATGYEVERGTSISGPFTPIRNFNASTTLFYNTTTDTSYPIAPWTNYWYRVRAKTVINNVTNYSQWSDPDVGNATQF
jgi:chitodextrinase